MLKREIQNFVNAVLEVQQDTRCTLQQAKEQVTHLLDAEMPSELEFKAALTAAPARRQRGRPYSEGLSKRDAVAAVAVYFESLGEGPEAALHSAWRWLGIFSNRREAAEAARDKSDTSLTGHTVSRKVAKIAIAAFKARTHPEQFLPQAMFAYLTFKPGTTLKLPAILSRKVVGVKKS